MVRVQNIMKINKSESRIGETKTIQEQLKTTKIEENKGASFCVLPGHKFDENKRKKCLVYCKCQ